MDWWDAVKWFGSIIGGVFSCKYLYDYLLTRPMAMTRARQVAELAARDQFEYFYQKYEMLISQRENEVKDRDEKIAERDERITKLEAKINKLEREVNARERDHLDCLKSNEELTQRMTVLENRLGGKPAEEDL